jgi:site-specific DNA recombinase
VEDMITDCEKKKEAAQQDVLTKENVFKMLLVFDKIFDKMNDVDKRKLIESMIAEVHLHPKETWEEGKNPIKEIKYAFPVSKEVMDALRENVASVETVVLLSKGAKDPVDLCSARTEVERRMVDSRKVKVDFSLEDMDLSEFKGKATYEQIKAYVLEQTGLKVSSLYIAQIKKKCGLDVGENFNLAKSENTRQPQCTPEKEDAIMQAFRHFGIL